MRDVCGGMVEGSIRHGDQQARHQAGSSDADRPRIEQTGLDHRIARALLRPPLGGVEITLFDPVTGLPGIHLETRGGQVSDQARIRVRLRDFERRQRRALVRHISRDLYAVSAGIVNPEYVPRAGSVEQSGTIIPARTPVFVDQIRSNDVTRGSSILVKRNQPGNFPNHLPIGRHGKRKVECFAIWRNCSGVRGIPELGECEVQWDCADTVRQRVRKQVVFDTLRLQPEIRIVRLQGKQSVLDRHPELDSGDVILARARGESGGRFRRAGIAG